MEKLRRRLQGAGGLTAAVPALDAAQREPLWALRRAGMPLPLGMPGDRKPITFVEDAAVAPARLPEFAARFRELLRRHGTDGCFYTVPSEPGGWKRRSPFDGELRELKLVSPTKAHAIVQFGGGASKDWGPVTIAEGTHDEHEFWSATLENAQTAG